MGKAVYSSISQFRFQLIKFTPKIIVNNLIFTYTKVHFCVDGRTIFMVVREQEGLLCF